MEANARRNRYAWGLGTIGRDMLFTMVSMYLMYYLTEVLDLPDATMWVMTAALTVLRVFDAVNDPIMGVVVDNTRTRWGKFKPWLVIGGIVGGILTILLFTDLGLTGSAYVASFIAIYLAWDLIYGANDIAYWSMLPALTRDQAEREKTGAFARICANAGMYLAVIGVPAVTGALGDDRRAWSMVSVGVVVFMGLFMLFTLFGVREDRSRLVSTEATSLRELTTVLFRNDQLMVLALALGLFMIGYITTTSFGIYFFKYAYRDEGMYLVFAGILGVAQLTALTIFPAIARRFSRKRLFSLAMILILAGYLLFFVSPMNMIPLGLAGLILFIGQSFVQVLMLTFLADCVEYGQWKLGRRNESVTFSVQPFINKIGGAIASGIVGSTLIVSGINSAATPGDVTAEGLFLLKIAMMILPLGFILAGFLVWRRYFRIDAAAYDGIIADLQARGDIDG